MKSFISYVVVSLFTTTFAHPLQAVLPQQASSFKIQILTPVAPSPKPIYLLSNGSTTTDKSLAATCTISSSTELFCGSIPIGAPLGAPSVLFSGVRSSDQTPHPEMGGKLLTQGFKIDAETSTVVWTNSYFIGRMRFVWKSDASQSVWAVFTEGIMENWAGADLLAVFD